MSGLYAVLGDPIAQSLSPVIHNGWIRDNALDADYIAMQVPDGEMPYALDVLAGRGCDGLNVTAPNKLAALELATVATDRAKRIGAANTLWRTKNNDWHADNTDEPAFSAALAEHYGEPVSDKEVVVLGAGGAARAVVHALHREGAIILLANRTISKAETLLADYPGPAHRALSLEAGLDAAARADLVVNTTSLGHDGATLVLPAGTGRLLYDISYGKAAQAVLEPAAANGWKTADGLSMLVYQAAFAFDRWFGIIPSVDAAMTRAARVLEAV